MMKKTQLLITALCASALLLGGCNNSGSKKKKSKEPSSSQTEKVLSSIAVTTNPTKTSYAVGESFDPSGMVVTATYSDGSTSDVTGQCTFSPSVMAESTTSVTVSYEGKTTTLAVNKADWSSADLEVFETASHGVKIPFPNEGEYTFKLDSYGDGEYLGGDSSAAKIASYKARFDTSWEITDFREGVGFIAEKEVETQQGTRYADVICAGYDATTEKTTEDGSGKFYLMVYDPYYYSWDDRDIGEEINYYFSYFASIGHASSVDAEIPLVGEFHHMSAYLSDIAGYEYYAAYYYAMGYRYTSPFEFEDEIDIYCDQTFAATFIDALGGEDSDFALDSVYEGAYFYSSKQGSLLLQVGYVESYGVLYIAPYQNSTSAFPSDYVKEVMDVYQPEANAFPAFAPSSTAYFYFEDFDNAYIVSCLGSGANVAEADLTSYISGLDSEKFEAGEKQSFEGKSYYVVSSKDGAYQFYAVYYEETETMWGYVEFEIAIALPTYASLPVAVIDSYWEANGLTVPAAHDFAVAGAEAYFELAQFKDGYFDIYVYGATSAELATFVAGFDTESWAVESDTEAGSYELICGDMSVVGNLVAVIDIVDYTDDEEDPYICLEYYVGVVPESAASAA